LRENLRENLERENMKMWGKDVMDGWMLHSKVGGHLNANLCSYEAKTDHTHTIANKGQVYFDFIDALFTSSGSKSAQKPRIAV
jgi:hypothetical protein